MILAAKIFENTLLEHKFSAENLIHFANYIDAFPKPGFIWQEILENEASRIIQNPPHFEIDSDEFMQSFRNLFSNFHSLNCKDVLTLSLFLLFFHRVMLTPKCGSVRNWDEVVFSIIDRTYPCNYYHYGV